VNHALDAIQNELLSELHHYAGIGTHLQEAKEIDQRHQTFVEIRDSSSKALEIINEVRYFNMFK